MNKPKIIIWGVDDYNTLALIRQVGQEFNNVFFLIIGKAHYAAYSKYCSEFLETSDIDAGYKELINMSSDESGKAIIITNGDDVITFIGNHINDLSDKYIIPGCRRQGDTAYYIDKYNMTKLAKECGITVPESFFVTKTTSIDNINFPCFIKPSHQKVGHYNEFKFKYCATKQDLADTLKYVRPDSVFIVQQFIRREKDLLVYGCRMPNGETVIAGGLETDRFAIGQGSSHGIVSAHVHPTIDCDKLKKFLDKVDYVGLFSFEYGLMDNKAYFFEVNLRNDGTSHFFYNAGANIPCAYALASAGLPYDDISKKVQKECNYMDEIFDISNVLIGKISLSKWKKQRSEVTAFKFYNPDDIVPYNIAKKNKWLRIIRDLIIKRFRLYILFAFERFGLRK